MKIKILTCFLVISCIFRLNTVPCQIVYFNETIDLAGEWGSGMSVLADDSVFHIAAITSLPKKVTIVELSQSGNKNWIKKYGNPQENWYPGNPGSLCPFPSGGYILGGSVEGPDTNYGLLLKFNHLFDTTFSKRYVNSINYSLILTCVKPTFDGGLIFTGEVYISGSNTDFILLKTDSIGNEIWRTTKSIGMADRGWSIIQTPDSGYVIGGYHYNPGAYHSGDPLILKFDKNGNFLWSRNPGGPYQDGKAMVCLNNDSTITVLTTIADSICTNDYDFSRICVIKYTQNGSEIWKKKYGSSIAGNNIQNIRSLPEGEYICCGSQHEPNNNDVYFFGWLLRLDINGDSLWFRQYYYSNKILPFYFNNIMDVSPTFDGGFIATGEVYDNPPNELQKIWVLKVDSLGCEFEGCDTTVIVEEQGSGEAGKQGSLVLWPNPCREVLSVKCLGLSAGNSYTLSIYDIFGHQVFSSPFQGGGREGGQEKESEIQLDVGDFPQGLYLVVLNDGSKIIGSSKLIISRRN